MEPCEHEAILVVCADPARSSEILAQLHAAGANALGPAPTAGLALALAAQTGARAAILAGQTTGRRSARELARDLTAIWGVDCYVLPCADESDDAADELWVDAPARDRSALHSGIVKDRGLPPAAN